MPGTSGARRRAACWNTPLGIVEVAAYEVDKDAKCNCDSSNVLSLEVHASTASGIFNVTQMRAHKSCVQ